MSCQISRYLISRKFACSVLFILQNEQSRISQNHTKWRYMYLFRKMRCLKSRDISRDGAPDPVIVSDVCLLKEGNLTVIFPNQYEIMRYFGFMSFISVHQTVRKCSFARIVCHRGQFATTNASTI